MKASIVIPCYNHGVYLPEALESALGSTYEDYEVIVVNDGSTDTGTVMVIKELEKKYRHDDRIMFIAQNNLGLAHARNNGIRASKGEYILPLDADNMIRPDYLTEAVGILNENPEVGVVYAWARRFGDHEGVSEPPLFDARKLLLENFIDACSVFRRRVWEECNGFDPDMGIMGYEDWDMWIGAMERGWKFHLLRKILYDYRVRGNSMIQACNIPDNRRYLIKYICRKHREIYCQNIEYVVSEKDTTILCINNVHADLIAKIDRIKRTLPYKVYSKIKDISRVLPR